MEMAFPIAETPRNAQENENCVEMFSVRRCLRFRSPISLLHSVITLAIAYELHFSKANHAALPNLFLFGACLILTLLILTVRSTVLNRGYFIATVALADTAVATIGLHLAHGDAPSLYIVYFLVMLIATASPSIVAACMLTLLLTAAYGSQLYVWGGAGSTQWLQLPILVIMGAFYAYNSQISREEIRQLKEKQSKWQKDPLTGLLNREEFLQRAEAALRSVRPEENRSVAILFIDLDKFKPVNDTYGHDIGDQLLIAVGKRMLGCLRHEDLLCRYGGDEFLILLQGVRSKEQAEETRVRLLSVLTHPFTLTGHTISIGASIGIATKTSVFQAVDDIIKKADAAMYTIKRASRLLKVA